MRHLYVVTHTEAQHHVDGLVGGWYDSELTARGRRQADQVAAALVDLLPAGVPVSVTSSDLRRAAQTAAPIAGAFGTDVREDPRLRELSYGVAGGRPDAWLDERFVPTPVSDRLDHDCGIDGAETKRAFATRVHEAVEEIVAEGGEHQVIVTHGFALTFVVTAWLRIPVAHVGWANFRAGSGSITHLFEDDVHHNRNVGFLGRGDHLTP